MPEPKKNTNRELVVTGIEILVLLVGICLIWWLFGWVFKLALLATLLAAATFCAWRLIKKFSPKNPSDGEPPVT